ncbi:hypothetical protein BC835DRAFT_1277952 [Cytidiella melzeri]|nr:hypothetical protein BC835DRAFT_1277952 [Cytidiella melzeri]
MLEPLAASVISTVLSARHLPLPTSAQSVFKAAAHAGGSSFPSNFFNPHPRRNTKEKERAGSGVHCGVCTKDGMSGGCIGDFATTSASADKPALPRRLRLRRIVGSRPLSDASPSRIPSHGNLQRQCQSSQRRHASSSSLPKLSHDRGDSDLHRRELVYVIKTDTKHDMNKAWRSYEFVRLQGVLHSIPVTDLLVFAGKLAGYASSRYTDDTHRTTWGARLLAALHDAEPRIIKNGVDRQTWKCLMSRALALTNRLDEAITLRHEVERPRLGKDNEHQYVQMHQTLLEALDDSRGPNAAIQFLVDESTVLKKYLPSWTRSYQSELLSSVSSFRGAIWDIIRKIKQVESFFGSVDSSRSVMWQQEAGAILIQAFCDKGFPLDATAVVNALQSRDVEISLKEMMLVVKTLAKHNSFDLANTLYDAVRREREVGRHDKVLFQRTGLYLYAHQGDAVSAQQCFENINLPAHAAVGDIGLLIHAYANCSNVKRAVAIFEDFFSGALRPNIIHFSGVILAYGRSGDFDGMQDWIARMRKAGFQPDSHVFSIILQSFAERGDTSAVSNILDQMRNAGQPPSSHTATSVIALLARRMDFRGAEEVFKRALSQGVVADRQMLTAIMNAHVEAGNWSGVITVFDYLKLSAARKQFPLSIEVFNTLLKAYVLAGAPWGVVNTLYGNISETELRPDAFTYSLLIQSACDNGIMDKAVELYDEMRQRASSGQVHLRVNVYVLTILMAGWLKKSNRTKAKEVYDLMLSQGIQPNSVTYHHIIKAYTDQKSQESVETALSFLRELMDPSHDKSWLSTTRNVRSGLERVYGPLLTAYTREKDFKKVDELVKEMTSQGAPASIGTTTAALDVYRRTRNLSGLRRAWAHIFSLAVSPSDADALVEDRDMAAPESRGTALCVPLSIYIDALSALGEHDDVALAWKSVREAGFSYDANNWNQLAIACVRAGQPLRAFHILQKVLIPNRRKALALSGRDDPTSPLSSDPPASDNVTSGSEGQSRDKARRASNTRLEHRRLKYIKYKMWQSPEDFAGPLYTMHRISPAWSNWGAHPKLFQLLHQVLQKLQAGELVTYVSKTGQRVPIVQTTIEGKSYSGRRFARLQIRRIKNECQDALAAVRHWQNHLDAIEASKRPRMPSNLLRKTPTSSQRVGVSVRAIKGFPWMPRAESATCKRGAEATVKSSISGAAGRRRPRRAALVFKSVVFIRPIGKSRKRGTRRTSRAAESGSGVP